MSGESRLPDAATVGGQAVLEGVMMRAGPFWAVAVRTPGGDVEVRRFGLPERTPQRRLLRLPVIRGVAALVESLRIGARAIAVSADWRLPEAERRGPSARADATVLGISLALGVALFLVAPAAVARLAGLGVPAEAVLRVAFLVGYLALLGRRGDMRRVLEYHGAEHKAVACHEAGLPLTPAHADRCPRLHPRCGTSFLALVMILAGALVALLGEPGWPGLVASRILVVPLAAGVAFELIRWAVRARAQRLLAPLVALQRLTTREPDREQLAVALAALGAVLAAEAPARASSGRVDLDFVPA